MSGISSETTKYLDPRVLSRISSLELRARLIVEGFLAGMHHSPYRGSSVEFADYRPYVQGDDLRHIDWKVFGRTDKFYVKEYEQETNFRLVLAVDCSQSMGYHSAAAPMTKHEYATMLAAAITYLALRQRDAVGLALFDERVTKLIKPSTDMRQWKNNVQELAHGLGATKTALGDVLSELADRLDRHVMVIVISDLFDDSERLLRGLKQLRYRYHEVIVWCVWDPAEITFPFDRLTRFDGLEQTGWTLADAGALRRRYLEAVRGFLGAVRGACGQMHIECTLFDTSQALDTALSQYLAARAGRLQKRSARARGQA